MDNSQIIHPAQYPPGWIDITEQLQWLLVKKVSGAAATIKNIYKQQLDDVDSFIGFSGSDGGGITILCVVFPLYLP